MKRNLLSLLALLPLFTAVCSEPIDSGDAIVIGNTTGIYLESESPSFSLRKNYVKPVRYRILDSRNTPVRSGEWPEAGRGVLTVDSLPRDFYTIRLEGSNYTGAVPFGIVPERKKAPNPDMIFAADSAQSWLAGAQLRNSRHPGPGFHLAAEAARRAGIGWVRDRLSWPGVNPTPDKIVWRQYIPSAWELGKRGVKVCTFYSSAPAWAKRKNRDLPDDLAATYRFARIAAERGRGSIEGWEFWNEEDVANTMEGAWDYAAALKAAMLGYRAGNPKAVLLHGSFSAFPVRNYSRVVMKNGAIHYFDVANFHVYAPLCDYAKRINGFHRFLAESGIPGKAIWVTENGTLAPGLAQKKSYIPNILCYSPEQENLVAEFVPKSQILMQSLGVSRNFFFVLSPYTEGARDWGLLNRDFTARPAYYAFATLVHTLGDATLQGELSAPAGVRAWLYRQPDGTQTVAFWSESELDTKPYDQFHPHPENRYERQFQLPAADGSYLVRALYGAASRVAAKQGCLKLTASRYPAYLTGMTGLVPVKPFRKPAGTGVPKTTIRKHVILRADLSSEFTVSNTRDSVDMKQDSGRVTLQIWNLSNQPETGMVTLGGARCSGLPTSPVTVAPMSCLEIPLTVTPQLDAAGINGELHFEGSFSGEKISPLIIPVHRYERKLSRFPSREFTGILEPKRWRANSSGAMEIRFDPAEKAIRFDWKFTVHGDRGDRWVYPEYILRGGETLRNAAAVVFEIKTTPSTPREAVFMAVNDWTRQHGKTTYIWYHNPGPEWETRRVSFDEILPEPEKAKMIRIGLNPLLNQQTFWIRNLRVIYHP